MMMDVWTHGAGVGLDVTHGLKQQQMFGVGAMYRYSVITCPPSQRGDKISPLWPATIAKERDQFQPVWLDNPEPNVGVCQEKEG